MTGSRAGVIRWRLRLGAGALLGATWLAAFAATLTGASPIYLSFPFALTTTSFVAVGIVLVERRPENAVSLLVLAFGTAIALFVIADAWVTLPGGRPGTTLAALAVSVLDGPIFLMLLLLFLLFPDGRLPSPRWRVLVVVAAVLAAIVFLASLLRPGAFLYYTSLENPLSPPSTPLTTVAFTPAYGLLVGCVAAAAGSLVVRWRRAGTLVRAQLKWVAAAAVVVALAMLTYGGTAGPTTFSDIGDLTVGLAMGLFPIAIGIAIMRYRLYEIDRIISRTIGWILVTGALVGVFAAAVVGLQAVLDPFTNSDTIAVAASTLAAATLFQPLRGRIQRAVDRRFDRGRYDGERVVAAFAGRLRDEIDLRAIVTETDRVARETIRPVSSTVWLRNAPNPVRTEVS